MQILFLCLKKVQRTPDRKDTKQHCDELSNWACVHKVVIKDLWPLQNKILFQMAGGGVEVRWAFFAKSFQSLKIKEIFSKRFFKRNLSYLKNGKKINKLLETNCPKTLLFWPLAFWNMLLQQAPGPLLFLLSANRMQNQHILKKPNCCVSAIVHAQITFGFHVVVVIWHC